MTFLLHVVKNAIPSIAFNTLNSENFLFKQPPNYEQNKLSLLNHSYSSRSINLERNIIATQQVPRVSKNTRFYSPHIENRDFSCKNRLFTRGATYGHLRLATRHSSMLFNSMEINWRNKYQNSSRSNMSTMRCEIEGERQGNMFFKQTSRHERYDYCRENKKFEEDDPNSKDKHGAQECKNSQKDGHECKGEHCDHHVQECRAMKGAYSKCAHHQLEVGHNQYHEDLEWRSKKNMHPKYTPQRGKYENELEGAKSFHIAKKGYIIKVSKELMGLFCYIEKQKRNMIKELAYTLKEVATVAIVLTCVKGFLSPLVEVFKTTPPTWSKLLLMLVSIDLVVICYVTLKLVESLEQLAKIATENQYDIMESVEKEEEMILHIAMEFVQLFKRLRNIAISITILQMVQLIFTVVKLKDPKIIANCSRIVQMWMLSPWT